MTGRELYNKLGELLEKNQFSEDCVVNFRDEKSGFEIWFGDIEYKYPEFLLQRRHA